MLMAGVYAENTDKISRMYFNNRVVVEHEGPERAAQRYD